LHRSGQVFLLDAFHGNAPLADSVNQLLVVDPIWSIVDWTIADYHTLAKSVVGKIGGLPLMPGVDHVFNMLLLALLRGRSAARMGTS
jgi:hypothetical protein